MSRSWTGPERRSFPRTSLSLPVQLTAVADVVTLETGNLSGMTRDVSRGGCCVLIAAELPAHARCIARFTDAGGRLVPDTVWGSVRRLEEDRRGFIVGFEFDSPLDELRISSPVGRLEQAVDTRPRVLVVDDQPAIRALLDRFLGSRGFQVCTVGDGEQAFRIVLENPPDVLLLDLYLPRMNGHDLLRRLKELAIPVGLIYTMSGYADADDARECLRLGAADHVLKPLDLEHLHRSIRLRLAASSG